VRGLPLHLISHRLPLARYSTHQRSICFTGVNCCSSRNFSEITWKIKDALPLARLLMMRLTAAAPATAVSYQISVKGWHRLSSLCRRRLNQHDRLGPPPIMKFLVGAVSAPPLRCDFHGKSRGNGVWSLSKPGMFTRPLFLQTGGRALNLRQINLNFMPSLWYLDFQTLVALLPPLYQGEG
jgi:hypothetical protein